MLHLRGNLYRKIKGMRCLKEHVTNVRMNVVATKENPIYTT